MEYYKNLSLEDLFYIDDDGLVCCEEWRDVINYEGMYSVSTLCRIKSNKRYTNHYLGGTKLVNERILRLSIDIDGYAIVSLSKYGVSKNFKTHRLGAAAFLNNDKNMPLVEHLNDIKTDNRINNLIWSNDVENLKSAILNNRIALGENHPNSKLTNKQVLEIRASSLKNLELSNMYGVTKSIISHIKIRRTWTHI